MCAGLRLDHLGTERLTWRDLWVFVEHLPPSSALGRKRDPDWWVTPELQMLREVHQGIAVLGWTKTKDAQSRTPREYPERLPLTRAEREAAEAKAAPVYDAMPVNEMADFLGWTRPSN